MFCSSSIPFNWKQLFSIECEAILKYFTFTHKNANVPSYPLLMFLELVFEIGQISFAGIATIHNFNWWLGVYEIIIFLNKIMLVCKSLIMKSPRFVGEEKEEAISTTFAKSRSTTSCGASCQNCSQLSQMLANMCRKYQRVKKENYAGDITICHLKNKNRTLNNPKCEVQDITKLGE